MGLLDFLKGNDNTDEISPVVITQQPVGAQAPLQTKLNGLLNSFGGAGNLGLQLLANSGYSTTPRSFGQILGQSALNAQQIAAGQQEQQLKQQLIAAQLKALQAKPATPPVSVSPGATLVDPTTGKAIYSSPAKDPNAPAAIQEYEYAKEQGFKGTLADWQKQQKTAPEGSADIQAYNLSKTQGFKGTFLDFLQAKTSQSFDPASVETTANMIAKGQMPMLSGFSLKTPWGQAVVQRVGELAPDYQGGEYNAKASAMRAFSSGTESRTVRSLNVAISHLDTLSGLADALDNNDLQAINKASNVWKTQTGNPAPTSFTSARDIVANEVVKAVTASGGSLADRQEAQAQIQAAASPAQLKGVIATWKQLLGGQLGGLKQQYEQGTGMTDFGRFLSPSVKSQLEDAPPTAPSGAGPVRISSDADYAKLPSGAIFIGPDGKQRKKP